MSLSLVSPLRNERKKKHLLPLMKEHRGSADVHSTWSIVNVVETTEGSIYRGQAERLVVGGPGGLPGGADSGWNLGG